MNIASLGVRGAGTALAVLLTSHPSIAQTPRYSLLIKGGHVGVGPEQEIAMMDSWIQFARRIAPPAVR